MTLDTYIHKMGELLVAIGVTALAAAIVAGLLKVLWLMVTTF